MLKQNRYSIFSLAVLLALLVAAVMPLAAFAQDETPPPADAPVVEEVPPADPPAAEEVPPADAPAADVPAEDLTVPEVLEMLPEGTDLAVVDENGAPVPLASEEAAEAILLPDPKFCPAGNCTGATVRGTIAEAIADAYAAGVSGTIFIEAGVFNPNGGVYFDGMNYPNFGQVPPSLAIIGAGSGETIINGNMYIRNVNAFTLQGFTLNGRLTFDTQQTWGIWEYSGDVNIVDVEQYGNSDTSNRINVRNGDLTITGSTFENNNQTMTGSSGGASEIFGNTFSDSHTGLIVWGEAVVSGNTFSNNDTHVRASLVEQPAGTTIVICDNVFSGNSEYDIEAFTDAGTFVYLDQAVNYATMGDGTIYGCLTCGGNTGGDTGGKNGKDKKPDVSQIIAITNPLDGNQLPGGLPDGNTLADSMTVVLKFEGQQIDEAPNGVQVAFDIPDGMKGKTFNVLFWDGGKWVTIASSVAGNMVKFLVTKPGIYALVVVP